MESSNTLATSNLVNDKYLVIELLHSKQNSKVLLVKELESEKLFVLKLFLEAAQSEFEYER